MGWGEGVRPEFGVAVGCGVGRRGVRAMGGVGRACGEKRVCKPKGSAERKGNQLEECAKRDVQNKKGCAGGKRAHETKQTKGAQSEKRGAKRNGERNETRSAKQRVLGRRTESSSEQNNERGKKKSTTETGAINNPESKTTPGRKTTGRRPASSPPPLRNPAVLLGGVGVQPPPVAGLGAAGLRDPPPPALHGVLGGTEVVNVEQHRVCAARRAP